MGCLMDKFKPMLAATLKEGHSIPYPVLASPKLDGVRAMVINGVVVSRRGIPIPNGHVQNIFGLNGYNGIDGELIVGHSGSNTVFRDTMSGVMTIDGEPDVRFYVFDSVLNDVGYEDRFLNLQTGYRVIKLNSMICSGREQLDTYEEWAISSGYEGVMLRRPSGVYKNGRSTINEFYLVKMKRFSDGEAIIIGVEELTVNNNEKTLISGGEGRRNTRKEGMIKSGTLGAIVVKDVVTGVEFKIGSGFSDEERKTMWGNDFMGSTVKYRYFPTGSKSKPRFPTFVGVRDLIDL